MRSVQIEQRSASVKLPQTGQLCTRLLASVRASASSLALSSGAVSYTHLYILEHVRDVLLRNIEQLRLESEEQQGRDPVDHCKSRIKSALSMEEKLTRRGLPVTLTAALENIRAVSYTHLDVYKRQDQDSSLIRAQNTTHHA